MCTCVYTVYVLHVLYRELVTKVGQLFVGGYTEPFSTIDLKVKSVKSTVSSFSQYVVCVVD